MTSLQNQIDKLLNSSKKTIVTIEKIINKSVRYGKIFDELDVEFKDFLDKLKSVLDFCANDISVRYAKNIISKVYFPIKFDLKTLNSGRDKRLWEAVEIANKKLYDYLENIQHNLNKNYSWLKQFNDLAVENKHKNFTIKWLSRSERMRIESKVGVIDWDMEKVKICGKITTPVKPYSYIVGTIFIEDMIPIKFFCKLCYEKIKDIIDDVYKLL